MKPHPDDAPEGVCSECGRPCVAVAQDRGIGYELMDGYRSYHERWVWLSPCCEAEVVPIREPLLNEDHAHDA